MPFCTKCGKENPPGARFCGDCGSALIAGRGSCGHCGKPLDPKEKFCSACGTPVNKEPPNPSLRAEAEEPKEIRESRKNTISEPAARPTDRGEEPPLVPPVHQRKKKGCMSRIFRFFALLLLLLAAVVIVLYFLPDPVPEGGGLTNTDIPGIVDIEPGDVSHLPENRDKLHGQPSPGSFTEERALKDATRMVEKAFASADTTQLKNSLTPESLKKYTGIFRYIQPDMEAYSKALASKKLVVKTEVFALYSIEDEDGRKFSAEFAQVEPGVWKLVRF